VHKVDKQHELDEDEEEAADDAEVHEDGLEGAVLRDVEGSDDEADEREAFEKPEAVLNHGPRVPRILHIRHHDHEEREEAGERETYAVDGKVADDGRAVDELIVVDDKRDGDVAAHAGQQLADRVLEAGREHDGRDEGADDQYERVGEPRGRRVLHRRQAFAAQAARGRAKAARHRRQQRAESATHCSNISTEKLQVLSERNANAAFIARE
jgi:hypothetical protein